MDLATTGRKAANNAKKFVDGKSANAMEEPFYKSGHFIHENRRRMVRPAGATALAPPTKYILKLKLKKKKNRENIFGKFLQKIK